MTIRFQCSECGIAIKAPAQRGGAQLPCPKCGKQLTIPQAEQPEKAADEAAQFAHLVASMESSSPTSKPAGPPTPATPAVPKADAEPSTVQPPERTPPAVTYEPAGRAQVKIVDIKLPFASVLRLGLQLWAVGFLVAVSIWIVLAIVAIVLSALGIGFSLVGS